MTAASAGAGVVLGGSLAGMFAASVLARHLDRVTIVERDELPPEPVARKGVPQAHHIHQLWSTGARLFDRLLPGVMDSLYRAGAYRMGIPEQHVTYSAYGWQYRFPQTRYMVCCSRPLIDWVVRQHVLKDERITVLGRTEATDLTGDAQRVTGVRVRSLDSGEAGVLEAGLVVDATGRGSAMKQWLAGLGLPPVQEDIVDSGITYATRLFDAPVDVSTFPLVSVYGDHRTGLPGRNALLFPVEGNRWLVTLSGTRGGEPPGTADGFLEYARGLRHPVVAQLLANAEPLSPVRRTRTTINRRLYYDRLPQWPEGLAVVGDALAAFNPFYGHGMISAARGAVVVDEVLGRHGFEPGTGRRLIEELSVAVDQPWSQATSQDICYPRCRVDSRDPRLTRHAAARQRFADLLGDLAMRHPAVSAAVLGVASLGTGDEVLSSPEVKSAIEGDAGALPPLPGPPFTDDEIAVLRAAGLLQPV